MKFKQSVLFLRGLFEPWLHGILGGASACSCMRLRNNKGYTPRVIKENIYAAAEHAVAIFLPRTARLVNCKEMTVLHFPIAKS